jgi:hypothetical protein
MMHAESDISAYRSIKIAIAAVVMAVLTGCAVVTMPLRPLTTSSQNSQTRSSPDFSCKNGAKCSNKGTDHRVAYRHSQSIGGGTMADDPPDFIGNQDGTPPIK